MATIVDGKMRSGELKDNDQVVVDVEAAGEGIFAKKSDVETDIQRIDTALAGKQDTLTFDNTPTEGSSNPVTSDGIKQAIDAATPEDYNEVKSQVQQNTQDIAGIEAKIPAQASAQNQLADKEFVNSSIATNTATFRGTYNLVTDLELTTSATDEQVAAAIATHLAALVPPIVPENNDYVFVQVPRETSDPTVIARVDRYKCSVAGGVTTWAYEWSLNNSSFTSVQWTAINSGVTSDLVTKLSGIESGAQVNVINTVKVNGAALTPDANKAVNIPVPVKATTAPVIAGTAAIGDSAKFAAENHVHPAETEVVAYRLPDDCFPITYTYNDTYYTVASNDGLMFDAGAGCEVYDVANGQMISVFNLPDLTWLAPDWTGPYIITNLKFANTSPTENTWPVLEKDAVFVREVRVAKEADVAAKLALKANNNEVLKNSGNQTLEGNLQVGNSADENIHLLKDTATVVAECVKNNYSQYKHYIPNGTKDDTLALLADIYAAVQQIAPAWVSGTTYAADAKVSYNGVVYARNTSGSITSSTNPASDTTNWEAKKVSELFLPLTGGTMSGNVNLNGYSIDSYDSDAWSIAYGGPNVIDFSYNGTIVSLYIHRNGIVALLQNLADDYSTSATYALNSLCVRYSKLYRCTTAITTAEAWTAAHWTEATVEDVLSAIRSALDGKAPLASPSFTGTPTAPTPTSGDASTKVATTAFVKTAVDSAKRYAFTTKTATQTGTGFTFSSAAASGYHYEVEFDGTDTWSLYEVVDSSTHTSETATDTATGTESDTTITFSTAGITATRNWAVALDDRAANTVVLTSSVEALEVSFPAAVADKVRDFELRLVIGDGTAAVTAPALILPSGLAFANADGELPSLADGTATAAVVTMLYFSEVTLNNFLIKGEEMVTIS